MLSHPTPPGCVKKKRQDEFVVKFFVDLCCPPAEKHWECRTFHEFLFEKASPDEIYFYLYCRLNSLVPL